MQAMRLGGLIGFNLRPLRSHIAFRLSDHLHHCKHSQSPAMASTYQLFCGRNIPDSADVVSEAQLSDFIRFVVCPRFDAFTVSEALGFWKGQSESTMVLSISCENYDAPKVQEIAELYKKQFRQDSVGIQQLPALSFV
jgi:hypothetical protein